MILLCIYQLYIDYKDFAEARGINPQNLDMSIGIKKMALLTLTGFCLYAANACIKLMQKNHLHPEDIGRFTSPLNHRWTNQRQ